MKRKLAEVVPDIHHYSSSPFFSFLFFPEVVPWFDGASNFVVCHRFALFIDTLLQLQLPFLASFRPVKISVCSCVCTSMSRVVYKHTTIAFLKTHSFLSVARSFAVRCYTMLLYLVSNMETPLFVGVFVMKFAQKAWATIICSFIRFVTEMANATTLATTTAAIAANVSKWVFFHIFRSSATFFSYVHSIAYSHPFFFNLFCIGSS